MIEPAIFVADLGYCFSVLACPLAHSSAILPFSLNDYSTVRFPNFIGSLAISCDPLSDTFTSFIFSRDLNIACSIGPFNCLSAILFSERNFLVSSSAIRDRNDLSSSPWVACLKLNIACCIIGFKGSYVLGVTNFNFGATV